MSVSPLFKKIVLGAVDQGIDVAGSMLLPGAWPIVKGALDPILDRLKSQLGGDEDITSSQSRAQAAIEAFEKNAHLQEIFRSSLLEEIGTIVEGQKDINEDIQKLVLIVEGNDQLLKEVGKGVTDITQILEEGVELSDASVEKLIMAITKRLETTRSVRAMAWQEMDLVGELASRQVNRLQIRAVELVQESALDRALDELQEGTALVSALINEAPTDIQLRLQLGFIYKTFAQVYDRAHKLLGDESYATQRDDFIQRAEKVFSYVKDDVSSNQKRAIDVANAIHGIGNVRQQRKDFKGALEYYRLAASLEPAHIYAWHDMVVAYYQMAQDGELDPDAMSEALTRVKELEARHTTLGVQKIARLERALMSVKGLAALDHDSHPEDNLEPPGEVGARRTNGSKRTEITVTPGEDYLLFVVQKDNPRPAFNVLTRLTNDGQQAGVVDDLEAVLTGPEGVSFRFVWNIFYGSQRGGQQHTKSSSVHPIEIQPGSSILQGIQFTGPDLGITDLYSWPTGRYQVEMTGRANRSPDRQSTKFSSKFYVDISSRDIAQLKEWIGWDDAAWARFPHPHYPDPDKAAGLPVRIVPG